MFCVKSERRQGRLLLNQHVCLLHPRLFFSLLLCSCSQEEPTYSALWGDNKAFNEVIISPAMLNEHMPHMVMEGLNKVCFLCVHVNECYGWGSFVMVVKWLLNLVPSFQHLWMKVIWDFSFLF